MHLFPAIDLIQGQAVRLFKGDYTQKTVYSDTPVQVAASFKAAGAAYIHLVDLEGAKSGGTPNFETIRAILEQSGLQGEIGGGIRDEATVRKYLDAGAMRVILGTAAITQPGFLRDMVKKYGERIAVGVDIKDGFVAIHGWTELSEKSCFQFCGELEDLGVRTVICTDISKDGVLGGTNTGLYRELTERYSMDFVASGGVSSLEDVEKLQEMGLYGAILGKALYTGALDLRQALALCKGGTL
jgi:phosphoribosylformimino-5-aminoimidazole carboxamide ribotide isomerase